MFTQRSIDMAESVSAKALLSKEELAQAASRELEWGENNEKLYRQLLDSLCSLLNSGTLHWRRYHLAFNMLT